MMNICYGCNARYNILSVYTSEDPFNTDKELSKKVKVEIMRKMNAIIDSHFEAAERDFKGILDEAGLELHMGFIIEK